MRSRTIALFAGLAVAGCYSVKTPGLNGVSSFDVKVTGVSLPNSTLPLAVVTPCVKQYGSQAAVPAEELGTKACPYLMPRGEVQLRVTAVALDKMGQKMPDFAGPVSFRAVPGDLTGGYATRWAPSIEGKAELTTLRVSHLFGEVRVWAEDAPPQPIFDGDAGTQLIDSTLPVEPDHRTFATGLSPAIYFEDPTIARVQIPDGFDNRSSPLAGQFITIGKDPESGQALFQSCANDPANDGQPVTMVVSGTDPSGFFVTDLTACRIREDPAAPNGSGEPEPDGYLPGTYGGMFIYNYSFPEGLDPGDRLFTLSGSVQEFTSTTQLTFPAWSIAEKVRELPPDQWDKYLKWVKPYEITLRTCGLSDSPDAFVTDVTCGQSKKNLKMESLESGLVKVRRVRFPEVFTNCDFNADTTVPFFCESTMEPGACAGLTCADPTPYCNPTLKKCVPDSWGWRDCNFGGETEPPNDTAERICLINCVTGQGEWQGKRCSERSTYTNFGQYVIEMAGPGAAEAGFDATLPSKAQEVAVTAASTRTGTAYRSDAQARIWCNANVRYKFGDSSVAASLTDPPLAKDTVLEHDFVGNETHVAFIADGAVTAGSKCVVAQNSHTVINLITKDAVPDLKPDCSNDDPDPDAAEQCRALHAATYDIVGHLRQVQPARPRWMIMPRDADDLCCHPGPGLSCPRPLKACP